MPDPRPTAAEVVERITASVERLKLLMLRDDKPRHTLIVDDDGVMRWEDGDA